MDQDVDRSGLFNDIRAFSQRKLKKVETKVTTGSGELVTEKRGAKGVVTLKSEGIQGTGYVVDNKPDLQVGMISPGLLISSQDVAQDKKSLETYDVTHILNLAYGVSNAFEDDYNYKKLEILDTPETNIRQYFDECFEFIDEARHYGNCLVHCNAGVSRCTTICTAYLMHKEKMTFADALNAVREARPFSKPNEGFVKQLEAYNDELHGGGKPVDAFEDAFTARKKAEIEAEKAMISGASNVRNRLKTFGAQLDELCRARSCSPLPAKNDKIPENKNKKLAKPPEPPEPKIQPKKVEPPNKKIIINNDVTAKYNDPMTSPKIDETPINVSAFRKNFESTKVQTPATPNKSTPSPWSSNKESAKEMPVENKTKKKIVIKQKSKEAPDEQPKRRSTKDLVSAIEKVNTSPATERQSEAQKPYRRRQTTQLVDKEPPKPVESKPISKRSNNLINDVSSKSAFVAPPPPPPPPPIEKFTSNRTIKLNKSNASQSPTPSPVLSNNVSRQSTPTSRSPLPEVNNTNVNNSDQNQTSKKLVFGCVRPPRMSISGRTLSQATEMANEVSKVNISSRSGSNSRSESPVSAINTTATTNKNNHNTNTKTSDTLSTITAPKISDNMVAKRSPILPLKKQPTIQKSSSSSSSDEELVATNHNQPQLKSNKKINYKPNKETETKCSKASLTQSNQSNQPSSDNQQSNQSNQMSNQQPIQQSVQQSVSPKLPLAQCRDNQSTDRQSMENKLERSKSGLNRSSTAAILNLIKTKTRADLTMRTVDEDDEIETLLMELEKEGIDNVDWDELGVDYGDVKDIVDSAAKVCDSDSDSSSDSSDSDDSDDEAVHLVINRQAPKEESSDEREFQLEADSEDESD